MIIQLLSRYNFIQVKRSCTRHASVNDQVAEAPRTIRFKEQERDGGGGIIKEFVSYHQNMFALYFMHWQKKFQSHLKLNFFISRKTLFVILKLRLCYVMSRHEQINYFG